MSLNLVPTNNIKTLTQEFLEIFKKEEENTIADMKYYLQNTNLSEEQKLKEYSSFRSNIFLTKINQTLSSAQQIVLEDVRLTQSKSLNDENVKLVKAQTELAQQEKTNAQKQTDILTAQKTQIERETDATISKIWLSIMETKVKTDLTIAQTLSEARKNGADVTKTARTYTDLFTGQDITYDHISLAAASASDTSKGTLGKQMYLMDKQGSTFNHHTKLQTAGQIGQTIQQAIAEGLTSIDGLMNTQKNIYESMFPDENSLFDTNYNSMSE